MLAQPTYAPAGTSGHDMSTRQIPTVAELVNLRDALAADEVTPAQAVTRLNALLATTAVPAPTDGVLLPSRLNFAGYCDVCLHFLCQDSKCTQVWDRLQWSVCDRCLGSGYADFRANGPDGSCEPCTCRLGMRDRTPYEIPTAWNGGL